MSISFNKKLKAAKELVKQKAVKKYIIDDNSERWVVVGHSRDYLNLVNPVWCRCYAFQKGIFDNPFFRCKHSLAVQLAMKSDDYDLFKIIKEEFEYFRSEWLS